MDNIPTSTDPRLLDRVLAEWQAKIKLGLDWLDYACGRVVKVTKDNKPFPVIYVGSRQYKPVMPDDALGNYCFFDISHTYEFAKWSKGTHSLIRVQYGLVFWFDILSIYPEKTALETEAIKEQVLELLTEKIHLSSGSYTIERISDNANEVFKGFAQPGYDEKYLLYPYAAIRFSGILTFTSR